MLLNKQLLVIASKDLIKRALMLLYKKCVQSPAYFMKNYSTIQHAIRGAIPFLLYPFQLLTVELFLHNSWNIILKSRQMGISTLCAGYILWFCIFQKDKTVLVVANTQLVAMNMIKKVKLMYDALPSWLREPLITDNKQSLQFKNNSSVKAAAATVNAGVSEALSLLVWDEVAVINNALALAIWTSALPTISTGGDCIGGNSIISLYNNVTCDIFNITILLAFKLYPYNVYLNINFLNAKILTPSGWSNFNGIRKIHTKKIILLKTLKDFILCTFDHKMKIQDGTFEKAINLNIGDTLYNNHKITLIKIINGKRLVYDAINVLLGNLFYANNLVVSNCILLSTPRGCVIGLTKITVRNKETGLITVKSILEVYNECNA